MSIPGVVNQVTGVVGEGDVDDCAVAAAYWCARYADPAAVFPTVPVYRTRAGNPDDPAARDGLTLDQTIRGSTATWPQIRIAKYSATDWTGFDAYLTEGWAANLGVISASFPPYLQFGFAGAHSIGVVKSGGQYLVANPLAPNGSAPLPCPLDPLRLAARRHGNGTILAALYQPVSEATMAGDYAIYEPEVESRKRGTIKGGTDFFNDWELKDRRGSIGIKDATVQMLGYRAGAYAIEITTAQGWSDGVARPTNVFCVQSAVTGVVTVPDPTPYSKADLDAAYAKGKAEGDVKKTVTVTISDGRPPTVITGV